MWTLVGSTKGCSSKKSGGAIERDYQNVFILRVVPVAADGVDLLLVRVDVASS